MSRVNMKVGIATLLLLLIAGIGIASAINLVDLDVSDDNITYGDTITITVSYYGTTGVLKIVDDSDDSVVKSFILPEDHTDPVEITVDSTGLLYPGTYYLVVADGDGEKYNSTVNDTPSWDGDYIVVNPSVPGASEVDIDIDDMQVAKGDRLTGSVNVYPSDKTYTLIIAGPNATYVFTGLSGETKFKDLFTSISYNSSLSSGTGIDTTTGALMETGAWAVKVVVADSVQTTVAKGFYVVNPEITLSAPSEAALGKVIELSGSTNVAETNSSADVGLVNRIIIKYKNESMTDYQSLNVNISVSSAGTWKYYLDLKKETWGDDVGDTIKFKAEVETYAGVSEESDVVEMLLKDLEIEITPTKLSVVRGDDFKIEGTTTLPTNSEVILEVTSGADEIDTYDGNPLPSDGKVSVFTGADGKFTSKKFVVKKDADLTRIKIKAYYKDDPDVESDEVSIKIVKQTLDLYFDSDTVLRGGTLKLNGSTDAPYLVFYCDEDSEGYFTYDGPGVITNATKDIAKEPTGLNEWKTSDYNTAIVDTDDIDEWPVDITVADSADAGSYTITIYGVTNSSKVVTYEDPQIILAVNIQDPEVTITAPAKVYLGNKVVLEGTTNAEDKDLFTVKVKFEGMNVKKTWSEAKIDALSPIDGSWVDKDAGEFKIKIDTKDDIISDYPDPGLYTVTVTAYYNGDEVAESSTAVELMRPVISVKSASQVKQGEPLLITIETVRDSDYPSLGGNIWLYVEGPNKEVGPTTVVPDDNGTATYELQTYKFAEADYVIYVRDDMRTISTDYPLTDESNMKASPDEPWLTGTTKLTDDALATAVFTVVKELPVQPTPTETPKPTPTPTKTETPKPTPTPTKTETPKPTPTETPKPTPTPTQTTPKPSPGFEAIFAVAGLLAVAYLLRRR